MYGPGAKKEGIDWFVGNELAREKEKARQFLDKHYSADTISQIMDFSFDVGHSHLQDLSRRYGQYGDVAQMQLNSRSLDVGCCEDA